MACGAEHRLIIVGLDNAGKTTIFYQFALNEVVVTSPTIGSNVEEMTFKNLHFTMWDVGGQETLRQSWSTYYTGAKGLLFVIDSTDKERLPVAKQEIHKMMAHEDLKGARVLIFANKQDAKGALPAAEISKRLGLTSLKGHSWHIQDCCALTGEGLYNGMEWMSSQIKSK
jgi:small GTP-binding protein